MALVKGRRAYVANVGDSRTYVLRQGQLLQVTRDHSLVADLVAAGQLTAQEALSHPQAGLITRCLGYLDEVEVDVEPHTLEFGDCLMLCSDGLWEALRDPEIIVRIIQSTPDLGVAAHRLVDSAKQLSGQDNISVVLLRIVENPDIPI
jgi:serine/threonine protein phosphatase PrpC